ncbi:MAG: sigma-70 family RNA polymerase sigma factor [Phycisphaerales bacterium]|nr:sigma-70 family RNA polymerase sigma factor [Phycisphaerales bacterium]
MSDAAPQSQFETDEAGRLDAEAVARTLKGDASAYDLLIERYQRRAVAVSYRLLGNIEDAMDVCQDAYVRAFKSLESLQQPARFGAWLMRIVSNLSLNYRRGRKMNLSLSTDDEDGGIHENQVAALSQDSGTSDALQSAEVDRAITEAIEALPEQQRLSLVLFAIEQIPQKEVAEILDCSVEMVKWNVFQARKTLKQALARYLEE